jgi:agmatine deiminase
LDDDVPIVTAEQLNLPLIDLNAVVLEGGAIEIDGQGTLMATRSSITGDDRNPGWTEAEIEGYFATYLGVEQVIWLDGQFGGNEDITDQHIDGFVKFASGNTMVTMSNPDLAYWYVDAQDRNKISQAENTEGTPYTRVNLPLTQNTVQTTWGMDLGFRSSYVNYYVGNAVVLVPEYNDPMDATALEIVQGLYPLRNAVGINCQNMLQWGGMVHCVTQQQPAGTTALSVEGLTPASPLRDGIEWLDMMGRKVSSLQPGQMYIQRDQNGKTKKVIGLD